MSYLFALLLFAIGETVGLRFPDFDFWLPFLAHRSAVTHGLFTPLALSLGLARDGDENRPARWLALGVCLATAVHLAFDLFPRAWRGYALIHLPFYGYMTPWFSQVWIAVGILGTLYVACRLLRGRGELWLSLAGLIAAYGLSVGREPHAAFLALLTLTVAGFIAFVLPRKWEDGNVAVRECAHAIGRLLRRTTR